MGPVLLKASTVCISSGAQPSSTFTSASRFIRSTVTSTPTTTRAGSLPTQQSSSLPSPDCVPCR